MDKLFGLLVLFFFIWAMYATYKAFVFLKFYFIEKWIAYLNFVIDDVFETIYMTKLTGWIANRTLPNIDDSEFLGITKSFVDDIYLQLGKMRKFYYTIFTPDQFREYIILKFINKVYETAGKQALELSLKDFKEQNKHMDQEK